MKIKTTDGTSAKAASEIKRAIDTGQKQVIERSECGSYFVIELLFVDLNVNIQINAFYLLINSLFFKLIELFCKTQIQARRNARTTETQS